MSSSVLWVLASVELTADDSRQWLRGAGEVVMRRLFEEGFKSAVSGAIRKRSLFVLSSLFVSVLILVALLALAPYARASDFLARKDASRALRSEENGESKQYIPMVVGPPVGPPPLLVADFDTCDSTNNLGGNMGAAYIPPSNNVIETYGERPGLPGNCAAHIEYHIKDWGAFWLQFEHVDLSEYSLFIFDIKGDASVGIPAQMKLEIKRDCHKVNGSNQCNEIIIYYFAAITADWQKTIAIELSEFDPVDWPGYSGIQDWSDIEELVFTFEANVSGQDGAIYLDNIRFGN